MPSKERNVAVKQYRAYYIVQRRVEGASLTTIAQELNVTPRTLTRDINNEHYHLLCEELLQQQLQAIQHLSPKDAYKGRQEVLKLIWPKKPPQTTITVGVNNNPSNTLPQQWWELDPKSNEYKNCCVIINSHIDQQLQDPNSSAHNYYQTFIETRVDQHLKDPNSQASKDFYNILHTRIDNIIASNTENPTLSKEE